MHLHMSDRVSVGGIEAEVVLETGSVDEELKRIEDAMRNVDKEIERFQQHFEAVTASVKTFEAALEHLVATKERLQIKSKEPRKAIAPEAPETQKAVTVDSQPRPTLAASSANVETSTKTEQQIIRQLTTNAKEVVHDHDSEATGPSAEQEGGIKKRANVVEHEVTIREALAKAGFADPDAKWLTEDSKGEEPAHGKLVGQRYEASTPSYSEVYDARNLTSKVQSGVSGNGVSARNDGQVVNAIKQVEQRLTEILRNGQDVLRIRVD
jgi:archaellum component FlaC